MSDRQCPSCGGFCKKSGCERANTDIRGEAVSSRGEIERLREANDALVCALDRIQDVLRGVYVDDVALIVNNALAKNKEATI